MSETAYTIKIKKEYASANIEDLKHVEAIEILEQPIPEWQKQETLKRLEEMKVYPSLAIPEDRFFRLLDEGENENL